MNFVTKRLFPFHACSVRMCLILPAAVFLAVVLSGCTDRIEQLSSDQIIEFEKAGPTTPAVDINRLVKAKISSGPYTIAPGEVLELTMPSVLQLVTAQESAITDHSAPYVCRVSQAGTINLPVVGEIAAGGKSLAEIEQAVIDAYYPKYARTRPSVFARVTEYKTARISVTGAVGKPGIYDLRRDKMSLVGALMEAGSIVDEGAAVIRITSAADTKPQATAAGTSDAKAVQASGEDSRNQAIRQAVEELVDQAVVRSAGSKDSDPAMVPLRQSNAGEVQVKMNFSQIDRAGTTGRLTARLLDRILLVETLDITSNIQRQAFIEKLIRKEPRIAASSVEKRLYTLAEQLRPGFDSSRLASFLAPAQSARIDVDTLRRTLTSDEAVDRLGKATAVSTKASIAEGRARQAGDDKPGRCLVLPVKGLNIPFADVALADGDAVVVEKLEIPVVSVVGLVNRPGNFPYPPDAHYNLMQAIAFAGGLNLSADPRYATIYRLGADGGIVRAPFRIIETKNGPERLTESLSMPVKPGDIVAVEQTLRTRTNLFIDKTLRFSIGTYLRLEDIGSN